jgi:signal peptidase
MTLDPRGVIVDLLERGHSVRFLASGDSMQPVIRTDDVLHVEPGRDIRVGDVVLTLAQRGLTAHRVLILRGGIIITRGDNAPSDDGPMPLSRVLGRVIRVERAGKALRVSKEPLFPRTLRMLRRRLLAGLRIEN